MFSFAQSSFSNFTLTAGQFQKTQDICAAVKDNPNLNPNTMMQEQKTKLINKLLKHRKLQHHGIRVSNLTAAQDITNIVCHIDNEVGWHL